MATARRCWDAAVGWHLLALTAVLVVVAAIVGTDASFSSDEGAAIVQARQLADGTGWLTPNPFPGIDPDHTESFLALSEHGTRGTAPYAKHVAYPLVLSLVHRLGGVTAMVGLSILATVAAAYAAGRLARRLDPRLERPALWVAGAGSPLLFDSQLVIAHSIGAALVGAAVLALVRAREEERFAFVPVAAGAVVAACLFRTEVILLAGVLAVAVVLFRWFPSRVQTLVAAGLLVGGAGATMFLDRFVRSRIIGAGVSAAVPVSPGAEYLSARITGLASMWVLPGDQWPVVAQVLLLVSTLAVLGGALLARQEPVEARALRICCVVAAVTSVAVVVGGTPDTIPSLGVAAPVIVAGIACVSATLLRDPLARLLAVVPAAFAVVVVIVQYNQAGAAEWGARFLAVALPLAIPVVLAALLRTGERLPPELARVALVALVVVTVSRSGLAVWGLRHYHDTNRRFADLTTQFAQGWGPDWRGGVPTGPAHGPGAGEQPIVLTTWIGTGRLLWNEPPVRGMTLEPEQVRGVAEQLHASGVGKLLFVAVEPDHVRAFDGLYRVVPTQTDPGSGPWPFFRLEAV